MAIHANQVALARPRLLHAGFLRVGFLHAGFLRAAAVSTGPEIGRHAAQQLARQELAKLAAEPLWLRILADIAALFGAGTNQIPTGWFGIVLLIVVLAAVIAVVLAFVRPAKRRRLRTGAVLGGRPKTARDYRQAARQLAATGDYSEAVLEGVRAIAAEIDERGILPPRLGRTADELAREAGRELPGLAGELAVVTRLFDDIRYGGRSGTRAGYELVSRVDSAVQTTPVAVGTADQAPVGALGVPR